MSIYPFTNPLRKGFSMTPLPSSSSRPDVKSVIPAPDPAPDEIAAPERREAPAARSVEPDPSAKPFGTGLRSRLGRDDAICW
jgi:hypothetical protein